MYKKLVMVKHKPKGKRYIFEAPGFSEIKKGDYISANGHLVKVLDAIDCDENAPEYQFITTLAGAEIPLVKIDKVYREEALKNEDV